jgi:hypothetical protein
MLRSVIASRSDLRIDLSASKLVKSFYTTLDEISGRVIFSPNTPVEVDDVVIDFVGCAKTWIEPTTPGAPRMTAYSQVYIAQLTISKSIVP